MWKITWILCVLLFSVLGLRTEAQVHAADENEFGIVYNKFFSGIVSVHTNGRFGFAANYGKIQTFYRNRYWQFEVNELRHVRELRRSQDFQGPFSSSRSYIFGKINNFYTVHAAIGRQHFFGEPASVRGVAVGYTFSAGPVLGLLKPYYLDVRRSYDNSGGDVVRIKYSEETADQFLNSNPISSNSIIGASGMRVGVSETSIIPGVRAKAGVLFDFSNSEEFIRGIEAGLMIDTYIRRIPLLAEHPNNFFFLNLYVSLQLGKRW